MPLTLEEYADHLDHRSDLQWPAAPQVRGTKSKPHLKRLDSVRAVVWNVYGTLLSISGGQFFREHPDDFVMDLALDKTIQEFKMWKAMSRKPGKPSRQLRDMLQAISAELSFQVEKGERYPEIPVERVWEAVIRKLQQNEYIINTAFYGPIQDFAVKIAYFFHRSLQGTGCDHGAAESVRWIYEHGYWQGLLADGQSFTAMQLRRGLAEQDPDLPFHLCFPASHQVLSHAALARKPSDRIFKEMLRRLQDSRVAPEQTLYVASRLADDLAPARRHGFITCLYTGDQSSVEASPEAVKDKHRRPHLLITDFRQVIEMLGTEPL
jgi:hypothetical protein